MTSRTFQPWRHSTPHHDVTHPPPWRHSPPNHDVTWNLPSNGSTTGWNRRIITRRGLFHRGVSEPSSAVSETFKEFDRFLPERCGVLGWWSSNPPARTGKQVCREHEGGRGEGAGIGDGPILVTDIRGAPVYQGISEVQGYVQIHTNYNHYPGTNNIYALVSQIYIEYYPGTNNIYALVGSQISIPTQDPLTL